MRWIWKFTFLEETILNYLLVWMNLNGLMLNTVLTMPKKFHLFSNGRVQVFEKVIFSSQRLVFGVWNLFKDKPILRWCFCLFCVPRFVMMFLPVLCPQIFGDIISWPFFLCQDLWGCFCPSCVPKLHREETCWVVSSIHVYKGCVWGHFCDRLRNITDEFVSDTVFGMSHDSWTSECSWHWRIGTVLRNSPVCSPNELKIKRLESQVFSCLKRLPLINGFFNVKSFHSCINTGRSEARQEWKKNNVEILYKNNNMGPWGDRCTVRGREWYPSPDTPRDSESRPFFLANSPHNTSAWHTSRC